MLIIGTPADFDTMFPPSSNSAQAGWAYGQVYWYLMRANPDFVTFRPGLADSFRFSDDSLQVSFFIHPGVKWHDGQPFTSADVVFAHEVCKAPEINFSAVSWLDHIRLARADLLLGSIIVHDVHRSRLEKTDVVGLAAFASSDGLDAL